MSLNSPENNKRKVLNLLLDQDQTAKSRYRKEGIYHAVNRGYNREIIFFA
jgi:hypothetical protein